MIRNKMSIFQGLLRNKYWLNFNLAIVSLLLWYKILQFSGGTRYSQEGGIRLDNARDDALPSPEPAKSSSKVDCEIVEQMRKENITVVMRTGATEAYRKLPIQLLTIFRCFEPEDLLIYSDAEDEIGSFKIIDILSNIPDSEKESNEDFDVYYDIQKWKASRKDFEHFPKEGSDGHPDDPKAWTLDKYKFIYMLEQSYHERPDSKWFVFTEADTYFFWSNLLLWLQNLDSSKELYLGSEAQIDDIGFGHGGSGFIMSKPALEKVFEHERGVAATWDETMKEECCGDFVVALLMEEVGINVTNSWPMLNGEYPDTMEFGPEKGWCEPAITMHHIPPAVITGVWGWELEHNHETPLLISDIFAKFVAPDISGNHFRVSWDNLSEDIIYQSPSNDSDSSSDLEHDAYLSEWDCNLACRADPECFQWLWKNGQGGEDEQNEEEGQDEEIVEEKPPQERSTCTLSRSFKLGKFRDGVVTANSTEQWISGWDVEKIEKWAEMNTCQEANWVS